VAGNGLTFVLPIAPGELAVNRAWRKTTHGMRRSQRYTEAIRAVSGDIRGALGDWPYRDFPVEVRIDAFWPSPKGDIDAPIKGILDALEKSGVIRNDDQVTRLYVSKAVDEENPRLELQIIPFSVIE